MTLNSRSARSRRQGTRSGRPVRWPAARSALVIASVVFLTLAGTGVAQAVWTAAAVNPTASAESGAVTIGQDGVAALATDYTSVLLTTTKPITLTNGAVPAVYELKLGSVTASAFASAVSVRAWSIVATGICPATPPTGTASTPLAEGVTLSGELAAGALARYCVQTSIANATAGTMASTTLTAQLQLRAHTGNWTSPVIVATAAQSITNTAPRDLAVVKKTRSSISLSWAAAEDITVTRYEVWRDGKRIGSAQSGTTFNDTGLTAGTRYSYVVRAVDANGNLLASSNELAVSTNLQPPASGVWYQVVTAEGTCVDAAAPQEKGRVLATKECSTASKFSFVADGQDYKIVASTATMVWGLNPPKENSAITLGKDGEGPKAEQRFTLTSLDAATAVFQIRSSKDNHAKCLQSAAASATLSVQTCDASAEIRSIQKFSLVEVTAP